MSWTRADLRPRPEVAFQQLQQAAKPLRSAWHERKDHGQLRDLALTGADTAGALRPCRALPALRVSIVEPVLQRDSAHLRRVGVKLPQLLNLLLDDHDPVPVWSLLLFALPCLLSPFGLRFRVAIDSQPTLSRNSSTALPMRLSRRISATVRSG